jgi:GWxTD domain-containing protein
LAIILFFAQPTAAKDADSKPRWDNETQIGAPRFDFALYHRLQEQPGYGRFDVIFEVSNDYLQFVRRDSSLFEASIDVGMTIEVKGGGEVDRQTQRLSKRVVGYDATNSKTEYLSYCFAVVQPPGQYKIRLVMTDKESGRRENAERDVTLIAPSNQEIDISDIVLMRSSEFETGSRIPNEPTVGSIPTNTKSTLFLLFDLWRQNTVNPSVAMIAVSDRVGKSVFVDTLSVVGGEALTAHAVPIDIKGLGFGKYQINLTVKSGATSLQRTAWFSVSTYGIPGTIRDLEQAVRQLKYIASPEEIKKLQEEFPSELETSFIAFWTTKFPCPGESVNGKMLEYYTRVNYSNENFSTSSAGWETDRGRTYITYGKPTDIEKSYSHEEGTAYEIWYYNSLGKRFVFRDDYGFGDFKLITPEW